MSHPVLAFGEVLWDLLPSGPVLGGAPFNFVYRVNSLGGRGAMISRLGSDELGDRALRIAAELGMEGSLIQRDRSHPTGTVQVSFDAGGNPEFAILPEVAYDYIEATPELERAAARAQVLCFGTLAQRAKASRRTLWRLVEHFHGRWLLLDINLRRDCYSRESIVASIRRADILKLNDTEAGVLAGIYGLEGRSLPQLARGLLEASALQYVVITLGSRGALAAARSGALAYRPAYRVRVVDTVGSGDAFTAAFLRALLEGAALGEALRDGNALGALVATQRGATQPADAEALAAFRASTALARPDAELEPYSA